MKKLSNLNISVLFLTFVAFLIIGSATLSFQTVNAQNMTVATGNATTADNATGTTGAENATGSISGSMFVIRDGVVKEVTVGNELD